VEENVFILNAVYFQKRLWQVVSASLVCTLINHLDSRYVTGQLDQLSLAVPP